MKFKVVTTFLALALLASAAGLSLASKPGVASAATGDVTITFTWWVTNSTSGTVAGTTKDGVGAGTLTGQFLAYNAGPPATSTIMFSLKGSLQSMTMSLDGVDAAVTGSVTDGWLKGQKVTGSIVSADACTQGSDGKCYAVAVVVNDPSSTKPAAPVVGNSVTRTGGSSMGNASLFGGLVLSFAGAAALSATALRRPRRSPRS